MFKQPNYPLKIVFICVLLKKNSTTNVQNSFSQGLGFLSLLIVLYEGSQTY